MAIETKRTAAHTDMLNDERAPVSPRTIIRAVIVVVGFLAAGQVNAEQIETQAFCDEPTIPEPVVIEYGNSSSGCVVSPAVDVDGFAFDGLANDQIRINFRSLSNGFDPSLELRNPIGTLVATAGCNGSGGFGATTCTFSLDFTLASDGTHFLSISDSGNNETGNYVMQIERLLPRPEAVTLAYNVPESDVISPSTDMDFFDFYAVAGTEVRINVRSVSNGFDPRIEVRDANDVVVIDNFCSGSGGFGATTCTFSENLIPALTGTYTVALTDVSINENGNYQLSVWCVFGPCDSDGDGTPDPVPEELSYDTSVSNTPGSPVAANDYTFQATVGTQMRVNLRSVSNGFDPRIEIRDPTGAVVNDSFCNGSAGFGATQCSEVFDLVPLMTGNYRVMISDTGINEGGSYWLNLWCNVGTCDADVTTPPLRGYITALSETVSPVVDADFFTFNATAGTDLRLILRSTSNGFDPRVEVRDPTGAVVLDNFCNGSGGFGATTCTLREDFSPATSGLYSLTVSDTGVNENGNFWLSLHCLFGDCDSDIDGIRDGQPPGIDYNTSFTDTVSPPTDMDFFVIRTDTPSEFSLSINSQSNGFDPVVQILDESGNLVIDGASDGAACDGSGGFGAFQCSFSINVTATEAATYILSIMDSGNNENGTYQLGLQCVFGFCPNATAVFDGDNCIEVANGPDLLGPNNDNQRDTDGDGIGNLCDGDLNGDCEVNVVDLGVFRSEFFSTDPDTDFNGDGIVNVVDLGILRSLFFLPPGPSGYPNDCTLP